MNYWVFIITFLSFSSLSAQKEVTVFHTQEDITIDGELNESIWEEAEAITEFWQWFPIDSVKAKAQTEIRLASDGQNLYVGIKCYGAGDDWVVPSLKRDYRAGGNDNMTLIFDTFDDKTNGFFFGINPYGVIREGLITNGAQRRGDFNEAWDNKWKGEAKRYDGYYTAELEIPYSTLRFNDGIDLWGLSAYRFDTQDNEISVLNQMSRNQVPFAIAFSSPMKWEKAPESSGSNISVIPYVSSNFSKDYEEDTPSKLGSAIGGDAKIGVSSGLNLDLTINPDFAQVEVDRQVTNVDRFEIFFPERRQFFLENADLFGSFGFRTTNPFFSRRIGVGVDRQTGDEGAELIDRYNRVLGFDFNFADAQNIWTGKTFLHSSFSPEVEGPKFAHGLSAGYNTRTWQINWEHEVVDADYNALVGFVRRKDFFRMSPEIRYRLYYPEGLFPQLSFGAETTIFTRPELGKTDQVSRLSMNGQMQNQSRIGAAINQQYVLLTDEFDPTGTSSDKLPGNTDYNYWSFFANYGSDPRQDFSFRIEALAGEYFNGNRYGVGGRFELRVQPKALIGIAYAYNYFDMPHLDGKRETFLIGPRIDYTFSKELFFTLFVQYNSQSQNTNINGRLQWRFAPVSDFFLVYTDNYATGNLDDPSDRFAFNVRNRGLVAKLTYWLNI